MLTGPYTVMDWSFNEFYRDRREACLALAREIRKEVEALIAAGAKIVRLTSPRSPCGSRSYPGHRGDAGRHRGSTCLFHHPHLLTAPSRPYTRPCLSFPWITLTSKCATAGWICWSCSQARLHQGHQLRRGGRASHVVEPESLVERRLRQSLEVLPRDIIWVDPDCGLKTRSVDEAIDKMKSLVHVAKKLRN